MAWSVKLQSGTGGTQGYNEWQAVYDATTQSALKLKYGFSLGNQAPDVLFHTPDNGAPIPVRANGANRLLFLTVDIPASATWDSVAGMVNTLARLVDGPNSQAVRAQTAGDVDKVRVAIKPNGATYTTYFEVLSGFMDTSTAFSEPEAVINVLGRNVTLALTCAPFGYGDSFTLSNRLASSPHMLEDSDADGLADGLALIGTPSAYSIATSNALIGTTSQRVVPNTTGGEGIETAPVTSGTSATAVACAWVTATDASDPISIILTDGSTNTIQEKTFDPSNPTGYDKTAIGGVGGATWYRYTVTGSNTSAANFKLRVYRRSLNASASVQFFVDGLYMALNTSTAPPAFSSARALLNRYDPTVAAANINYLDLFGIPGDAPAWIDIETANGDGAVYNYAASMTIAPSVLSGLRVFLDSSVFGTVTGSWSTGTSGTPIGGNYLTTSLSAGSISYSPGPSNEFFKRDWRVFAKVYSTVADATFTYRIYSEAPGTAKAIFFESDPVSVGVTSQPTYIEIALIKKNEVGDPDNILATYDMVLVSNPSTGTLRFDGLLFLPASEQFMLLEHPYAGTTAGDGGFHTKGSTQSAYTTRTRNKIAETLSVIETVAPGQVMTRIVFMSQGTTTDSNILDVTDTFNLTLTITPRTSHLLGVS